MKIVLSTWRGDETVDIAAAVERTLDGRDYGSGQLEACTRATDNIAGFLGRLVEALAENGAITTEDLSNIFLCGVKPAPPE